MRTSALWSLACVVAMVADVHAQVETPKTIQQLEAEPESPETLPLLENEVLDEVPKPVARIPAVLPAAAPSEKPKPVVQVLDAGLKPLLYAKAGPAELEAAWDAWRKTIQSDPAKAEQHQRELLKLKGDLGISDLDTFSTGFIRASRARKEANDPSGAVALASAAVELSPHLPFARFALASAYWFADMLQPGRAVTETVQGMKILWSDPRYRRPAMADVGVAFLFAWLMTAVVVTTVQFVRRSRYFLHDFHHFFPKAMRPWQTAALAVLVLSLPWVFRLGVVPVLLGFFAASVLYLSLAERALVFILLVSLGALPTSAGMLVQTTTFAGTAAEDVYLVERGGLHAQAAYARLEKRVKDGRAEFADWFATARYQLRRGELESSIDRFKQAAQLRTRDARVLTNMGTAMLAKGDVEGAIELYRSATAADPKRFEAFYNLAEATKRRAAPLPTDASGPDLEKAATALQTAKSLDPTLVAAAEDVTLANRLLLSAPLDLDELEHLQDAGERGSRVRTQVALKLLGVDDASWAYLYPGVIGALLFALGFGAVNLRACRVCGKCGRAVCRRCDPQLPVASAQCGQCVNVFGRTGVVPAALRIRKQIEVAHHHQRMGKLSYLSGILCSGAGHLITGLPLRGALYAFVGLFLIFNLFFRAGVLRAPYGEVPMLLRFVPACLALVAVYALSLRDLYKRQA